MTRYCKTAALILICHFLLASYLSAHPNEHDTIENWIEQVQKTDSQQEKVQAFYKIITFYRFNTLPEAAKYSHQAIDYCHSIEDSTEAERFRFILAEIMFYSSNYRLALKEFDKFIDYHSRHNNPGKVIEAYNTKGYIYMSLHEYDEAIKSFMTSYKMATSTEDTYHIARTNMHLGRIFYSLRNFEYALNNFDQAYTAFESIDSLQGVADILLWKGLTISQIANSENSKNKFLDAYRLIDSAKKLYNKISKPLDMANALRYIADFYILEHNRDLNKAKSLLNQALKLSLDNNQRAYAGDIYTILAYVSGLEKNIKANIKYNEMALDLRKNLGSQDLYASSLINLAGNETKLGHYEKAENYLRRALEISRTTERKLYVQNSHRGLYANFKAQNIPDSALKYLELYKQVSDEISIVESRRQVSGWQLKELIETHQTKQKELIHEKEKERIYFIVIIILITIIAGFTFNRYREKKKSEKELENTVKQRTAQLEHTNEVLKNEVNERIAVQIELKKNEERIRSLLENISHIAVVGYDATGKIEFWNNASTDMFGYSHDFAIGRDFFSLLQISGYSDKELRDKILFASYYGKFLDAGEIKLILNSNSSVIPCFANHFVSRPSEKNAVIFSMFIDLTEQKSAQENYKKLNEELELRVAERTAELDEVLSKLTKEIDVRKDTESKLLIAKDDLHKALESEKELTRLKTSILTRMSHEFRTPLTVILSSSQLLKKYFEMGDRNSFIEHIDRIGNSVEAMNNLLQDVMTVSMPQNIIDTFHYDDFLLEEVCREELISRQLLDNEMHAIELVPTGKEVVYSQKGALRLVISNMLSNAIKFSPAGSAITIEPFYNENNFGFEVRDHGKGIMPEDLEKVFDQFYRGSNIDEEPGIGLGLTIVKAYTESLGGDIELHSKPGRGTRIKVIFPHAQHID